MKSNNLNQEKAFPSSAIGSLISGFFSLLLYVVGAILGSVAIFGSFGLVLGIISITQSTKAKRLIALNPKKYRGSGISTIGFILGMIGILYTTGFFIIMLFLYLSR